MMLKAGIQFTTCYPKKRASLRLYQVMLQHVILEMLARLRLFTLLNPSRSEVPRTH